MDPTATPREDLPARGDALAPPRAAGRWARGQHLALVLWVAVAVPFAGSIYALLGGTRATDPLTRAFGLYGQLIHEVTGLAVLGYVLARQRRSWKRLGWRVHPRDAAHALALLAATSVGMWASMWMVRDVASAIAGLGGPLVVPRALDLRLGWSIAAVAFVCLNPVFEELIVRAYLMTEIVALGGSRGLAVAVSVSVQLSYHLYQGLHAIPLGVFFTLASLYYARSRRLLPLIAVHLLLDLQALGGGPT